MSTTADTGTRRSRLKSDRRSKLLAAAERLIAERGYLAVRLEDIGAAAGVSGPAIYRHFPNKEALLVELLVGISTRLLAGAQRVLSEAEDVDAALGELVDFHLDFALEEPDLIRIQDRDLAHLPDRARRQVRRAQRQYVEIWVDAASPAQRYRGRRRTADGPCCFRAVEFDTAQRERPRRQGLCRLTVARGTPGNDDGRPFRRPPWGPTLEPISAAGDRATHRTEDP